MDSSNVVTKTIDGHEYEIAPFLGMRGWQMQMKLGKMIGPALKEAIGALPKGSVKSLMSADIDPSMVGGAVTAFIDALASGDPDGKFAAQLLSQTQRDGVALNESTINKAYSANYGEMFKALIAVVVANGFFGLGDTGLELIKSLVNQAEAQSEAQSPEKSTKA